MRTAVLASLALMMSSVLAAPPAFAHKGHRGGDGGGAHARVLKELNLSKEQKDKLAEIRKKHKESAKPIRESMKEKRKQMEQALQSDASKEELKKIHGELQKSRSQLGDLRFEEVLAIRDVLTPEQRKKFKEEMKERRGKFKRGKQADVEGEDEE